MKPVPTAAAFLILLLAPGLTAAAPRDVQTYAVSGSDTFSIGPDEISSEVSYCGNETLTMTRHGTGTRLRASVVYTRDDGAARSAATGEYVADVAPSGDTLETADRDPDNLTVLNQPFAAKLTSGTLHDLEHLRGALPFDFPSPFTRSSLHGYLAHIPGGTSGGRRAVGVRFEAAGAMHGELPDRPGLTLTGTITMRGTAFYDASSAVLLALETTVTVSGKVSGPSRSNRVKIVYTRALAAKPSHYKHPISPRC